MPGRKNQRPFARLVWEGRQDVDAEPEAASLRLDSQWAPPSSSHSPNQLILGDNLGVMRALLPEWREKIDLIYADPPFLSGKRYSARIGRNEDSRKPQEWDTIQGYTDSWVDGSQYLNMLYPRLLGMYDLLSPQGTLYLHLDWHASSYARIILDEIFGPEQFLNEIIWVYHGPSPIRSAFKRKHDTILVYTKSNSYTFNADAVRVPYKESTLKTFRSSKKAGFGKKPDLQRGKVPEDWWYFPVVARLHKERTGYPTQKPEALLERILRASSNPGDLVADFFAGAGTTALTAARLDRRWIACDAAPLAITTCSRRLLLAPHPPPFDVWVSETTSSRDHQRIHISVQVSNRDVHVGLNGIDGDLSEAFPDCINTWEVDWMYDGKVFRIRSFAARPWRGDEIPLELGHRYENGGEYTIAVRALSSTGMIASTTELIRI